MAAMVKRCWQFNTNVVIGYNHTGAYNKKIGTLIDILALQFVDHTHYKGRYLMKDKVHLNELGHKLYFENIRKVIP